MKIAVVTDAWHPQVNGVVRTLTTTGDTLKTLGHEVRFVTPMDFRTIPCPTYPEIRLAFNAGKTTGNILDEFTPDAIHIATEGPLGHAAHRYCRKRGLPFTTAFHTQFPEYIRARVPLPVSWSYNYLRRFHGQATRTLVPTPSQRDRLISRGFKNLAIWSRGVDTKLFRPRDKSIIDAPRPVSMFVGRVAVEKNLEAFLSLDLPGTKYVVGGGPDFNNLNKAFPEAVFTGMKHGEELAALVAAADVFVFPSLTDTFGLVMLEAMACGVPVAAYPVTGPMDVVVNGETGILDDDLKVATLKALELDPENCVKYANLRTWQHCTETFASNLAPI